MIYEASLGGLVRVLFWFFAAYFVIRLVARMALPVVIRKSEEHMRKQAEAFRQQQGHGERKRAEGEVTVERNDARKSTSRDGDYVDYVEIKD
jgi:hypothetical protein